METESEQSEINLLNSDSSSEDSFYSDAQLDNSSCSDNDSDEEITQHDEEIEFEKPSWERYTRQFTPNNIFKEGKKCSEMTEQAKLLTEAIDFFNLFFDQEFYEQLSVNIHLYYTNNCDSNHKKRDSHHKNWSRPSKCELEVFFGILIYMGINQLPNIKLYWQKNTLFSNVQFQQLMSLERFSQIRSSFCFAYDKNDNNKTKSLSQLKQLIKYIIKKFNHYYFPQQYLSVDESMIKFSGRSPYKVYMPLKPIKYGFKIYILSESNTGYILNWILCEGKQQSLVQIFDKLLANFKFKNYHISFDRFYTSIQSVYYLTQLGFKILGAIMINRLYVNDLMKEQIKKLQQYESLFYTSTNKKLLLSIWKDSKTVLLISNYGSNLLQFISRTKHDNKIEVKCPQNIVLYQRTAKGVDYFDQMIQYYHCDKRSKKWKIRIICHILSAAIYNSFILYKQATQQNINFLSYNIEIMNRLFLERLTQIKTNEAKQNNKIYQRMKLSPEDCELTKSTQRICQICLLNNSQIKKYTTYFCLTHEINVCPLKCYDQHRKYVEK